MNAENITSTKRLLITITVMLVAVIEVLDMTIVNVSLPSMMGSLGANTDQITWVLTSYIVSAAIFMPLTGFLVNRLGRKRLLLLNILGFLAASMLCGAASNLAGMVFFRILQGAFGAALVPLSQYILRDTYPPEQLSKAMAIWGIGVMVGPVLGPTIGGYITEALTWRWIFYVNAPFCILAFVMALSVIEDTPRIQEAIDWLGMALMIVGIGTLQIFLDRGNSEDWFHSPLILILFLTWVSCLTIFVIRGWHNPKNIINLQLFRDRNFATATGLLTLFTAGILGSVSLQPIMMERLMGYSTATAGLLMAPRGIASAFGMMFVPKTMSLFGPRRVIFFGILTATFGTYLMTKFNIESSQAQIMFAGAVQGFGMGSFFVPLATIAFDSLPKKSIAEASGLFSFGRNLGISIGISILSTLVTRLTQINWNRLGGHIQPFNPNLWRWLNHHGWTLHDPIAIQQLASNLANQSGMIAFQDVYWLVAISFMVISPIILLIKDTSHSRK